MFGGVSISNSNSSASRAENDARSGGKSPSPDSPDADAPPLAGNADNASASGGGGKESPPARSDSGENKKRRSSGVGSKASSLLASARNSLNFSQITRSGADSKDSQSPLQKLGKHDPALVVPQGPYNNSAGESRPSSASTFRVGVWEDRNRKCRRTMEDTHAFLYNFLDTPPPATAAEPSDGKDKDKSKSKGAAVTLSDPEPSESDNGYFAIFDGHAGTFAADWCGKKLHLILEDTIRKHPNSPIPEMLDHTFTLVDAQLEKLPLKNSGCTAAVAILRWEDRVPSDRSVTGSVGVAQAAQHAIANTNKLAKAQEKEKEKESQAPQSEKEKEGPKETIQPKEPSKKQTKQTLPSEEMTAKLRGQCSRQRVLYTANVGDARIVLCRAGLALRLTYDHKGSDENEGKRIAGLGGLILNNRVNGVLAVTRALGDSYMKDLVTGHPYTTETVLQPHLDEFIIIACDGLWDVCSDQEAVDLVRDIYDPTIASKLLVDHALNRFSTDNLSCMIVRMDRYGIMQSRRRASAGSLSEKRASRVSEADRIVQDTKQKISDGKTPAVGVSPSNHGRGFDQPDTNFLPTILNGAVEEEPGPIGVEGDSPEVSPMPEIVEVALFQAGKIPE